MTEAPQQLGFRAQIRELLRAEPVALVPVTERNISKFEETLNTLAGQCHKEGMVSFTGNLQESPQQWRASTQGLWLFGKHEADFSNVGSVAGFVNVYAPQHMEDISAWLPQHHMRPYDDGALLEFASFVRPEIQDADELELSASRQALAKLFLNDEYKHVRAVTVWVTHDAQNTLNPEDASHMKQLGGWELGTKKYDSADSSDSTCFLVTRKAFLDTLTGKKQSR